MNTLNLLSHYKKQTWKIALFTSAVWLTTTSLGVNFFWQWHKTLLAKYEEKLFINQRSLGKNKTPTKLVTPNLNYINQLTHIESSLPDSVQLTKIKLEQTHVLIQGRANQTGDILKFKKNLLGLFNRLSLLKLTIKNNYFTLSFSKHE